MEAEWWMADPQVAARKDPRVSASAPSTKPLMPCVTGAGRRTLPGPRDLTPRLPRGDQGSPRGRNRQGNKPRRVRDACRASNQSDQRDDRTSGARTMRKSYTVVENAGYERECDVHTGRQPRRGSHMARPILPSGRNRILARRDRLQPPERGNAPTSSDS